jgi:hypothetical protein
MSGESATFGYEAYTAALVDRHHIGTNIKGGGTKFCD